MKVVYVNKDNKYYICPGCNTKLLIDWDELKRSTEYVKHCGSLKFKVAVAVEDYETNDI